MPQDRLPLLPEQTGGYTRSYTPEMRRRVYRAGMEAISDQGRALRFGVRRKEGGISRDELVSVGEERMRQNFTKRKPARTNGQRVSGRR
jgi:hypothetical protein